jgi:hypothetical protein
VSSFGLKSAVQAKSKLAELMRQQNFEKLCPLEAQ